MTSTTIPFWPGLVQCKCWSSVRHDGHCWSCQMPIMYVMSRNAYITNGGHTAYYCEGPECQGRADVNDREYGIPIREVLRRRHPLGLHVTTSEEL